MVQTDSLTTEGYTEMGKIMAGEASTVPSKIVCIKTSCTADATQTYAGITKATESGMTIAAATCTSETTTVTDDTLQAVHEFTAGEAATIKGHGLCNTDGDVLFSLCCYATDVVLASGDKLNCTSKIQFKAD